VTPVARPARGGSGLIERLSRNVSRFILLAGGFLIVAATALIVTEIFARQLFRRSLGGIDEVAGFALAIGTSWSFGAVLLDKGHVRIDTLYARFGRRTRAVFDIVALGGTVLFAAALAFFASQVLATSLRFGTTSQSSLAVPVAVPQALWVAGLVWFLLVALGLLVACVVGLAKGNWRQIERLGGATEIEAEVRAEVEQTTLRQSSETGGALT
jgi:TRAP-type C4-dicarboxylate transport system permease small subunit